MLMYEYIHCQQKRDFFIFELLLHWPKRFHIICGIARGLLYLHQDFKLRIIR
ncbi:putative non-specific serine/threonine protein kinase [Rosa chinensis]|uniref:Putative non-specific serine/threonine protein kinase n=1 Tax=Rosa chinensis TaxID=74649 RepID=A0A2P6QBI5_ROSCH|nr:putative non-specific serine/threonine protein kinase [Rosa chinensis]